MMRQEKTMQEDAGEPRAFPAQLTKFEVQLLTPEIPGELVTWADNVKRCLRSLRQTWPEEEKRLETLLQRMAKEDPALLPRVDRLRDTLADEAKRWSELMDRVEKFDSTAEAAEPDEARAESGRESLVQAGLKCIQSARRLTVEVETWLNEALTRDRGVAD